MFCTFTLAISYDDDDDDDDNDNDNNNDDDDGDVAVVIVSCHRPFLPGTSLETTVIPNGQASIFRRQYFPYYV